MILCPLRMLFDQLLDDFLFASRLHHAVVVLSLLGKLFEIVNLKKLRLYPFFVYVTQSDLWGAPLLLELQQLHVRHGVFEVVFFFDAITDIGNYRIRAFLRFHCSNFIINKKD